MVLTYSVLKDQSKLNYSGSVRLGLALAFCLALAAPSISAFIQPTKIEDCAGIFAGKVNVTELKNEIDKLREEY